MFLHQVGSFNYDNTKMIYRTYYLPLMPNSTESILDYRVDIKDLNPEDTFYLPAETGNYSVAGFEMVLNRKVTLVRLLQKLTPGYRLLTT